MKQFSKKYQVWEYSDNGDSAYTVREFDTLEECMSAHKSLEWYITKRVALSVKEVDEVIATLTPVPIVIQEKSMKLQGEAMTQAEMTIEHLKGKHNIKTTES